MYRMKKAFSLHEIQKIELDILSHIDEFCKKKGIKYFLGCGTLLGAVRHHGFIPWDDDIDIYMLREDYDRFIKEHSEGCDNTYRLLSIYNDPLYYYDTARVVDSRTSIVFDGVIENPSEGLWVDIFPLDNMTRLFRLKQFFAGFLSRCRVLSVYTKYPIKKHSWVYYPLWLICKAIGPRFFLIIIERIIKSKKVAAKVGYVCSEVGEKGAIKREWCEDDVKVMFEGKEFPTFSHYDEYLVSVFGDYMTLPPVEKRLSHPVKAYWR